MLIPAASNEDAYRLVLFSPHLVMDPEYLHDCSDCFRTTDNMDLVRAEAASLMASKPDVVVATGGRVLPILLQLSSTIPVVIPGGSDPVRVGYTKALARPGGNVTGFALFEHSMLGKSLEILKQIAPAIVRVGLIYNPDNPNGVINRQASEAASGSLAIEPIAAPIHGLADIDRAVTSLADRQNSGIFFCPTSRLSRCATKSSIWPHGTASRQYIRILPL
jgi:putative tryptophan/tyrosine transport system substrate-binding protein